MSHTRNFTFDDYTIDCATYIYCNGLSVNNDISKLESVLQKRIIPYSVRVCSGGRMVTACIDGNEYSTGFWAKVSCRGKKMYLMNNFLHEIYNSRFEPYEVTKKDNYCQD